MARGLIWWAAVLAITIGPRVVWAVEYRLEGSIAAYRWVEDVEPLSAEESGPVLQLGGYVGNAPGPADAPVTVRGDVRLLLGHVGFDTYNVDLSSGSTTPIHTNSTYLGLTQEGSIGYRHRGGETTGSVEPFMGLGYRWWWREIGGGSGYGEYYRLLYGRLGVRTDHPFSPTASFRMTLSIDPVLWAREKVDLSDFAYPRSGTTFQGQRVTLKNGRRSGWTLELTLRQGNLDLTGFWQAVRLGESNHVGCFESASPLVADDECWQPESTQDLFGVRVGVSF